jgi:hypothetical protein
MRDSLVDVLELSWRYDRTRPPNEQVERRPAATAEQRSQSAAGGTSARTAG